MNHHDFEHHFRSAVKVQFNWNKFITSDWPIELRYFSLPEKSDLIYTAWYALADGSVCGYDAESAKPKSVAAAASNTLLRKYHGVREAKPPEPTSVIPAYKLNHEKILLLDGNHRTVSAQFSGSKMALAAFVVRDPIDKDILPDLVHWTQ